MSAAPKEGRAAYLAYVREQGATYTALPGDERIFLAGWDASALRFADSIPHTDQPPMVWGAIRALASAWRYYFNPEGNGRIEPLHEVNNLVDELTAYAGRLKAALKKLREDEWRATIDWGPRNERDAILEEVDAVLAESDGGEARESAVGGAQLTQAGGDSGGMPLSVGRSRPDQTATNSGNGVGAAVRYCICADPENCTDVPFGYRCRKLYGNPPVRSVPDDDEPVRGRDAP